MGQAAFQLQLNSFGMAIELGLVGASGAAVDLSPATSLDIELLSPEGVSKSAIAFLSTDGKDGLFNRTITSGELNEPGSWRAQGSVVSPKYTGKTSVVEFTVIGNLT